MTNVVRMVGINRVKLIGRNARLLSDPFPAEWLLVEIFAIKEKINILTNSCWSNTKGINSSYNLFQFGLFLRETFEKTLMHYKKAKTSFSLEADDFEWMV